MCKYRRETYQNTYHNTCQIHQICIGIHANTYQHALACIRLVFGMYELMIRANTDPPRLTHAAGGPTRVSPLDAALSFRT